MDQPNFQDDPLYPIAITLLNLLEKPTQISLKHPNTNHSLTTSGTLIQAFNPPTQNSPPSLTLMVGAHSLTLRPSQILLSQETKQPPPNHDLKTLRLLLTDGYTLQINPTNKTQ